MNSIRRTIGKSKISPLLIFIFILLLNLCSVEVFAFPDNFEHHQETVTETHGHSYGDTHSQDATHSHDDKVDPFCCSTIKAIGITSQKILSSNNLKTSSRFSYHSQFAFIGKIPQLLLVWDSAHDPGPPPDSILFKSIFLKATPSHAPPITHPYKYKCFF